MAASSTTLRAPIPSPVGVPTVPSTTCPPPCPACGGLECLCRPRFFAGQVLTEGDLNRLENYVVAKNRLHNRYFQGPGVVCGLEVVCDGCNSGNVIVMPGYAISPCGDDIIVCQQASVPMCSLINQCKPPQDNCDPYGYQQPMSCTQGVQTYLLSICYSETPARGVQPLMSQPCSCKCAGGSCACGGAQGSNCNCGCSGNTASATPPAAALPQTTAKYNPQCEPTLICEGFTFTATQYNATPPKTTGLNQYGVAAILASRAAQLGPLLSRVLTCYLDAKAMTDAYAAAPTAADPKDVQAFMMYSQYVAALRDFASQHVAHRCDLSRQLLYLDVSTAFGTPVAGTVVPPAATTTWAQRFQQLNAISLELFRDCMCSALLPPCMDVTGGNCVPIAVVTMDVTNCRVIEICNWTAREFALTLPTLYYWTSFIPWASLRNAIAQMCCGDANQGIWEAILAVLDKVVQNNVAAQAGAAPGASGAQAAAGRIGATAAATPPGGAAAGGSTPGAVTTVPPPGSTLLALQNFVAATAIPDGVATILSALVPTGAANANDIAALKSTVAQLQKTVAAQSVQLQRLARGN